jgi:hypothetical protein
LLTVPYSQANPAKGCPRPSVAARLADPTGIASPGDHRLNVHVSELL